MILVFGDVIDDVVVRPREPITPDSDTRSDIRRRPGGSAANQAAWLGRLGCPVSFVGRVGAEDVDRHHSALAAFGVDAHLVPDEDVSTGAIVVLLGENGDRTMFTDRGAATRLSRMDIPDSLLRKASHVHLTGYSFFEEATRAATLETLDVVRAYRIPFSIDPGSVAFLREVGGAQFREWVRGAVACFPNRDEAAVLTRPGAPAEMAAELLADFPVVALTLGADGVVVASRHAPPVHVPAAEVECLDPTGAGDAFCAGFLATWLAETDTIAAARAGVATAGVAIGQFGARPM